MTKILIAILIIVLIFGEIVAIDFITSLHFHSDVVCGLVQNGSGYYAIVCSNGAIYVDYGSGSL